MKHKIGFTLPRNLEVISKDVMGIIVDSISNYFTHVSGVLNAPGYKTESSTFSETTGWRFGSSIEIFRVNGGQKPGDVSGTLVGKKKPKIVQFGNAIGPSNLLPIVQVKEIVRSFILDDYRGMVIFFLINRDEDTDFVCSICIPENNNSDQISVIHIESDDKHDLELANLHPGSPLHSLIKRCMALNLVLKMA